MLALCLMLLVTYYAFNYASIIGLGLIMLCGSAQNSDTLYAPYYANAKKLCLKSDCFIRVYNKVFYMVTVLL